MSSSNEQTEPKLYTEAEAAAILRVHRETLASWRRSGKVKLGARFSWKVLYTLEDINAIVSAKHLQTRPVAVPPSAQSPR